MYQNQVDVVHQALSHTAIGRVAICGLLINCLGFVVLAFAENKILKDITFWLNSLDFTVETLVSPDIGLPQVRFTGVDERLKKTIATSRRVTQLGWLLVVVGVLLQIPSLL